MYNILHQDTVEKANEIKKVYENHKDNQKVVKYYVKSMSNSPYDGSLCEVKCSYLAFKEAEKVNEEELVKKFNYNELTQKLLYTKVKHYPQFFKQDAFQNLLSQALRDAGVKTYRTPGVITLMADFNGRKGDFDNAIKYVERALKLAEEVLDGVKVHQKFVKILMIKADILQKKRRYQEAMAALNESEEIAAKLYGNKENYYHAQILNKKAMIYAEIKGEEYKSEDLLKEQYKITNKIVNAISLKEKTMLGVYAGIE